MIYIKKKKKPLVLVAWKRVLIGQYSLIIDYSVQSEKQLSKFNLVYFHN